MMKKLCTLFLILSSITTGLHTTTQPQKARQSFLQRKVLKPLKKHKYKVIAGAGATLAAIAFARWKYAQTQNNQQKKAPARKTSASDLPQNEETYTIQGEHCPAIPHHYVIVPKKPIENFTDPALTEKDRTSVMMAIITAANKQAKTTIPDQNLDYNLIIYNGASAGQKDTQLYCHWTAGRKMFFMPRTEIANAETASRASGPCRFCDTDNLPIIMKNDDAFVIKDINRRSQNHFLIIPFTKPNTRHIVNLKEITAANKKTIESMTSLVYQLAQKYGDNGDNGFTLVSNNGSDAHQTVMHMHWHFASGSDLGFITTTDYFDTIKTWRETGKSNYSDLQKKLFPIT